MPEHENHEPLIQEWEPQGDESIPPDVREAIEYGQFMVRAIGQIEQRTGRTSMTAKAKRSVIMAVKLLAVHHAIGGKEE